ncbi:MAG: glycosyltransferase, partial [Ginsengibacter sp.]
MIGITIVIFGMYVGLIIYYRQSWLQIPMEHEAGEIGMALSTNISIIIPARNEEKNIYDCLQSIVSQTYPKQLFEVIVIDDHSTDFTAEIVQSFKNRNVSLVSLKDFTGNEVLNSYKKK